MRRRILIVAERCECCRQRSRNIGGDQGIFVLNCDSLHHATAAVEEMKARSKLELVAAYKC